MYKTKTGATSNQGEPGTESGGLKPGGRFYRFSNLNQQPGGR